MQSDYNYCCILLNNLNTSYKLLDYDKKIINDTLTYLYTYKSYDSLYKLIYLLNLIDRYFNLIYTQIWKINKNKLRKQTDLYNFIINIYDEICKNISYYNNVNTDIMINII